MKRILIVILMIVAAGLVGCSTPTEKPLFDKTVFDSQLGSIISITMDEAFMYIDAKANESYVVYGEIKDMRNYEELRNPQYWIDFWDDSDKYNTIFSCSLEDKSSELSIGQTVYLRGNIYLDGGFLSNAVSIEEADVTEADHLLSFDEALEYDGLLQKTSFRIMGMIETQVNQYNGEIYGKLFANQSESKKNDFNYIYVHFAENELPKNGEYIEVVGKLGGIGGVIRDAHLNNCCITERGASVRKRIEQD